MILSLEKIFCKAVEVHSDFHGVGENWECPVKGGPITESIFTLVPFSKNCEITVRKLFRVEEFREGQ